MDRGSFIFRNSAVNSFNSLSVYNLVTAFQSCDVAAGIRSIRDVNQSKEGLYDRADIRSKN